MHLGARAKKRIGIGTEALSAVFGLVKPGTVFALVSGSRQEAAPWPVLEAPELGSGRRCHQARASSGGKT